MTIRTTALALLLLGLLNSAHAQLQWEHQYPGKNLERLLLDHSGETYLLRSNCQIDLFRPDHTPWQSIALRNPAGWGSCSVDALSENQIDQDPGLEIVFRWEGDDVACPVNGIALQNDNGDVSLLNDQFPYPHVSAPAGLAPKLLAGSSVYSLPGPQVEHDYGYGLQVYRLPLGEAQYLVYENSSSAAFAGFQFFDAGHQWLKTVNLPVSDFRKLRFVSQDYFNDDALLEFAGLTGSAVSGPNPLRLDIVQENGNSLLSFPCETAVLDQLASFPDRYLLRQTQADGSTGTVVLDPFSRQVLHVFAEKFVTRFSPDGSTELYWAHKTSTDPVIRVYDAAFALRQTLTLPEAYRHFWNLDISSGYFTAGTGLAFCFSNQRDGLAYVTVLDENGQFAYDFPGATQAQLDRQPGLKPKFLLQYPDRTAVYGFADPSTSTATDPLPEAKTALRAYPNPFDTELVLEVPEPAGTLDLFDLGGQRLQHLDLHSGTSVQLPTAALPPGVYWVQWKSAAAEQTLKVVKGKASF